MYAIAATSYRAIASASDVGPGETAVDVIPDVLLVALRGTDARQQRDAMLRVCDWTQGNDSPLAEAEQSAWATYRQALRDVPEQPGFPDSLTWPTAP